MKPRTETVDVQVVGGGPAGLAFALRAAREGLRVRVADRASPPIDKPCGEGLMPDGVELLAELGVALSELPSRPFRGIRYLEGPRVAEGTFPGRPGLGIRRTALHAALARQAEEAGVELLWGVKVTGLSGTTAETDHGPLAGRWLVGADGLRSRVRRWTGLEGPPAPRIRFGMRRHFHLAPWTDRVEVYWADDREAYVTPVAETLVGVALLWNRDRIGPAGFDDLLDAFPALQRRLTGAEVASRDRGCGPLEQRTRGVVRGRVALLGDASGYVDAITGEGLSLAFHQGRALADALRAGDLARYRRACRRLRRVPDALTRLLLWIERRPRLRRRMIGVFHEDPELFDRFLAIHARERPPSSLGLGGLWRTARGLLATGS